MVNGVFNFFSRQDDLTIEKKMRVEDFYLLCEKFNQNDDQLSESERKSRGTGDTNIAIGLNNQRIDS